MDDPVDTMIDRVRAEWHRGEPLYYTMQRVWTSTDVTDSERRALAFTGWQAVVDAGGPPQQYPLPQSILDQMGSGDYDDAVLSDSDVDALAVIGFFTVASERLYTDGWTPGGVQ